MLGESWGSVAGFCVPHGLVANDNPMANIFIPLFLLSAAALILGLVKPSWLRMPTRKRASVVFGGATIIFFILVAITVPPRAVSTQASTSADPRPAVLASTTTQPAQATNNTVPTPAPTPQPPAPVTDPEAADRAQLEQLVYDALHGTNNGGEPYIKSTDIIHDTDFDNPTNADGSPRYSGWTVNVAINIDGSRTVMNREIADLYISLYSHRTDLVMVGIKAYEPLIDKYGNPSDGWVYGTFLKAAEAYKVNWSLDRTMLEFSVLPGLWTVNYDASAANSALLEK